MVIRTVMLSLICLPSVFVVFHSAELQRGKPNGKVVSDRKLIDEMMSMAKDTVEIDHKKFYLDAYAWRDFQPGGSDGRLRVINRLYSTDRQVIEDNIDIVEQFVIHQDSVWVVNYDEWQMKSEKRTRNKMSTGGPRWDCYSTVSVVSRIHDSTNSRDYFVRSRDVIIERTD